MRAVKYLGEAQGWWAGVEQQSVAWRRREGREEEGRKLSAKWRENGRGKVAQTGLGRGREGESGKKEG